MSTAPIISEVRFRAQVVIGDTISGLTDPEIEQAIDGAVEDFSRDHPKREVTDHLDTDLNTEDQFEISDLNSRTWDRHTDRIQDIESPIDFSEPSYLIPGDHFRIIEKSSDKFFIQFFFTPDDNFRITADRKWTTDLIALDTRATKLVGLLTAARVARVKSAIFANINDPTQAADAIDYAAKSARWDDLADSLEAEYARSVKRPEETQSAGNRIGFVDFDPAPQKNRRGRYLVHNRHNR